MSEKRWWNVCKKSNSKNVMSRFFLWKIRDSFLTCVDYRQPLTARQSYVKLLFSLEDCIFTNVKTALQVIIKTGHHSYQCVPLCVLMTKTKVHTDAINKCFYCGKSSPLTSWQIDNFCWRHQKIGMQCVKCCTLDQKSNFFLKFDFAKKLPIWIFTLKMCSSKEKNIWIFTSNIKLSILLEFMNFWKFFGEFWAPLLNVHSM